MNATRFLDTDILLYAYDLDAPAKRKVALEFLEHGWNKPGETAPIVIHETRGGHSPTR